jgi:hypothetical protein
MNKLKQNEDGLIPLLVAVLAVVIFVIVFVYLRVINAQ